MRYLNPQQLAERWNCSARHVRRLCANGQLPAMRLLGSASWRIREDVAEAYEAGNSTAPKTDVKPAAVVVSPVAVTFTPGDFELPADYTPRFPALWGLDSTEAKVGDERRKRGCRSSVVE